MEYAKAQEIKGRMFSLNASKSDTITDIFNGYIFGKYAQSEHYTTDELAVLYDEMWNEHYNIPVFAPLVSWKDTLCTKRVVLTDEAVKNIAIDALPLIQYVTESGLTVENITGSVRIYVNYVLDEHKAIFEAFGGHIEDNPYPTTTAIEAMTVAELNTFAEEHLLTIEGWSDMLKAQKVAALIYVIYGV